MSTHRDYQIKTIDAVFTEWMEGNSPTMFVLPTGCGKTHCIAGIVERVRPRRSIVVAHREELLFQAREKIWNITGIECEIEKAEMSASTSLWNRTPCVVASVQTLVSGPKESRRMRRFNPKDFGALIIDEFHHATAPSYREIMDYFQNGNPDLKICGCTATPDRGDEEALGQICKSVAFDYEILDAIHDGWLVQVEQMMVKAEVDFSGIRTTCGDLNGADLAAVMEAEEALQGVAGATLQIAGDKRTLVFTVTIKQAEILTNIFNRHKPNCAEWVCGNTPKDTRRSILERFESGQTQIVVNCAVYTEGYNNAKVEVIAMARPTKSRSLYAQCCGRALRPLDGIVDGLGSADERKSAIASSPKPSALIIDFVGNSGRHKLMSTADILGGNVSEAAIERAVEKAKEEGKPVNMQQLLDEEEEKLQKEAERRRLAEEARKARVIANVTYRTTSINPFDAFDLTPAHMRGWDNGRTLSEKQAGILRKQGVNPDGLNYAQGRQVLNEIFRHWRQDLASMKQCAVVRKHFPDENIHELTRSRASELITILKNNGWKRPQPASV